ncbi:MULTISPECIES: zinc-dependent peptidase [Flavobacterium]|uniref:zinc-dependent peptidase n=1 Tax=Flavobacterium TaxID=237 RepID=UPI001FCC1974|nr:MULTISPECIES: zinc-dependent peptidase [Flavobacterium]UOK42710.1 zinc-dependent peptidase [Flavobacterium enshiense]
MEKLLLGFVALFFVGMFLFKAFEKVYVALYKKPLYIHFYPFLKRLKRSQRAILKSEFVFYNKLTRKEKKYFEHRVVNFIAEYEFVGKSGLVVNDQMKVHIAATSTMLTFGMKNYLYDVFEHILIYPDEYYSITTEQYHKGEFNPSVKVIAFSWKDFQRGFSIQNDNHNLGLHEFAHALNFQAMKSYNTSMNLFSDMFDEIMQYIHHLPNAKRLIESNYFRIYAYTNKYEFLAVILEHFFESPDQFKREFPELYHKVELMINFKRSR